MDNTLVPDYLTIAQKLTGLRDRDLTVRQQLVESGELYHGYHPQMEQVHLQNAHALQQAIAEIGWPTKAKVGAEANGAAWLVVQHAISMPNLQRQCLQLIEEAVQQQVEDKKAFAYLYDRICFNERKPQKYGTQYDWDEQGQMSVWKLENPEQTEALRKELGLLPLQENTLLMRQIVAAEGGAPPADYQARQQEIEAWSRRTGWICEDKPAITD